MYHYIKIQRNHGRMSLKKQKQTSQNREEEFELVENRCEGRGVVGYMSQKRWAFKEHGDLMCGLFHSNCGSMRVDRWVVYDKQLT